MGILIGTKKPERIISNMEEISVGWKRMAKRFLNRQIRAQMYDTPNLLTENLVLLICVIPSGPSPMTNTQSALKFLKALIVKILSST